MASASQILIDDEISKDQNNWIKIGTLKALRKSSDNRNDVAGCRMYVQQFDIKHFIQKHGQTAWEPAKLVIDLSSIDRQVTLTTDSTTRPIILSFAQCTKQLQIPQNILTIRNKTGEEEFFFPDNVIKAFFEIWDVWLSGEYDVKFDIQHIVHESGESSLEPATFYINCIGPKNWQFKLTAKGLSRAITFPIDQYDERTEISKDILTVYLNPREEQFLLTKKAIEAIDDRLMNWEIALSNRPKTCPSCTKEGYANGVCLNCGYIRKTRLFFLKIGYAVVFLMLTGLFFFGLEEKDYMAIGAALIGSIRLLADYKSRVRNPVEEALKIKALNKTNIKVQNREWNATLSYELPFRGFGLLFLAGIISWICGVRNGSTTHIILIIIFGLFVFGGHLFAGFVCSIISLTKGKIREALWGFFVQSSMVILTIFANIVINDF